MALADAGICGLEGRHLGSNGPLGFFGQVLRLERVTQLAPLHLLVTCQSTHVLNSLNWASIRWLARSDTPRASRRRIGRGDGVRTRTFQLRTGRSSGSELHPEGKLYSPTAEMYESAHQQIDSHFFPIQYSTLFITTSQEVVFKSKQAFVVWAVACSVG